MLGDLLVEFPAEVLGEIIALSPVCVIGIDRSGVVRVFNDAAERMMGYSRQEALGRLDIGDIYGSMEVAREVKKKIHGDGYGGPGRVDGLEIDLCTRDGRKVPVRLSAMLLDHHGEEVGSIGFFHDLTETRKIERERMNRAKLRGALEMAGAASHELGQPLQVILSDASFLMGELQLDQEGREALESITNAARRLSEVVRKIQHITRYETVSYVGDSRMIDLDKASESG